MTAVAVVNCGIGNLHSVRAALRRAAPDVTAVITDRAEDIAAADKVILPGDGHFDACMRNIDSLALRAALTDAAASKPFLGICVGMQALFASSDEGAEAGLGIFPQRIVRLPNTAGDGTRIKIPHIGWNTARRERRHEWTDDTADGARFYFVHSYCAPVGDYTLMSATYGMTFSAVIARGNLWATQFHPEKSGAVGARLFAGFVRFVRPARG